jgi:hypothetical protein
MRRRVTLRTVVTGTSPVISRSFFMQPPLTLHDFVINLLSDADARAAFDLDPDGALREAGLTGVTPADVRDVIPLVADFAPAHVAGLPGNLPAFATSALGTDRDSGVHPLQFVTAQLPGSTGDLTLAAAGGLQSVTTGVAGTVPAVSAQHVSGDAGFSGHLSAGDPGGAHISGAAGASGGAAVSGDFSPAHDPAGTLDPTGPDTSGLLGGAGNTITGAVHGTLHGTLGGSLGGQLDGLGHDPVGHLTGTLDATVQGLGGVGSHALEPGHLLDHTGLDHTGLTGVLPAGLPAVPDLHSATGLLHGSTPLGLGGSADTSAAGHAAGHADAHLLDLPHLL